MNPYREPGGLTINYNRPVHCNSGDEKGLGCGDKEGTGCCCLCRVCNDYFPLLDLTTFSAEQQRAGVYTPASGGPGTPAPQAWWSWGSELQGRWWEVPE